MYIKRVIAVNKIAGIYLAASCLYIYCTTAYCHTGAEGDPPVQWASYLVFEHNNYGYGGWSGKQAVGQPNVLPPGRLSPDAFRIKNEAGSGKLVLGFYKPLQVSQILIAESHMPGRISKITVSDTDDREYLVRAHKESPPGVASRLMVVTMDRTPYKVKKVSITINAQKHPGWSQIDAVGISTSPLDHKAWRSMESLHPYRIAEFFATHSPAYQQSLAMLGLEIDRDRFFFKGNPVYFIREYASPAAPTSPTPAEVSTANWLNGHYSRALQMPEIHIDGRESSRHSLSTDGIVLWSVPKSGPAAGSTPAIYSSYFSGNGWASPNEHRIAGYANLAPTQDFFMANDGSALVMAIDRSDGFGSHDLYISVRETGDRWTTPVNLGPDINSDGIEYAPYLTADNAALFFSSNRMHADDADLYVCTRIGESWTRWSAPRNVGSPLNSTAWDGCISTMPLSVAPSKPGSRQRQNPAIRRTVPQALVCLEPADAGTRILKGLVIDRETSDSLGVVVRCHTLRFGKDNITKSDVTIPNSGSFLFPLQRDQTYMVDIEHEDYVPYGKIISPKDSASGEGHLRITAQLVPLKINQVFKVEDLLFVRSKAQILPESLPALQKVLKMLRDYPDMRIEIGGHTDNIGGQQANLELSQKRAESVKEYLEGQGIDDKRITAVGYGGSKPVAPNYDPDQRKLNRRVEIKILGY